MISIRWSSRAAGEFEALINRIREDNPEAALSMARNVLNRIAQIQTFPNIGRPGERPGTAHKTGNKQPEQPEFKIVNGPKIWR